jgi:hypothetical protein
MKTIRTLLVLRQVILLSGALITFTLAVAESPAASSMSFCG